jgi:hypothetical protein
MRTEIYSRHATKTLLLVQILASNGYETISAGLFILNMQIVMDKKV